MPKVHFILAYLIIKWLKSLAHQYTFISFQYCIFLCVVKKHCKINKALILLCERNI